MVERDRAGEARAQCLLESFGAVEMACADGYCPPLDSQADYLVHPDGNVHAWCSFTAYAVPQLGALGWAVEIADGYPYRVVSEDAPWYAGLEAGSLEEEEEGDWFSLELGIEVDGRRVNLLPALVELLDECADSDSLESLLRMPTRFRVLDAGDGKYLPVPPERLRSLLRVVVELYRGERLESGALCLSKNRTAVVAAASADRKSFGCNDSRELTYFGEAFYRDALAGAGTLPAAFESARAALEKKERAEGILASLPRASFGAQISAHLQRGSAAIAQGR